MNSGRRAGGQEAARREQARQKAAALRAAEQARERRRRTALVTGAVVLVLALVVGIGVAIQSNRGGSTGPVTAPANLTDGAILVGKVDAPVTVTIYEDFQCPACKAFEAKTGATLTELRDAGTIRVLYRPIAFLDRASTTDYSSRALNAAACLVQEAPQGFPALHEALFAQQPAEGSAGLPDATLVSMVAAAGAPGAAACIDERTFGGWARQVTDQSSKDGISQTPTLTVDGTTLTDLTPAGLRAAVSAAA